MRYVKVIQNTQGATSDRYIPEELARKAYSEGLLQFDVTNVEYCTKEPFIPYVSLMRLARKHNLPYAVLRNKPK